MDNLERRAIPVLENMSRQSLDEMTKINDFTYSLLMSLNNREARISQLELTKGGTNFEIGDFIQRLIADQKNRFKNFEVIKYSNNFIDIKLTKLGECKFEIDNVTENSCSKVNVPTFWNKFHWELYVIKDSLRRFFKSMRSFIESDFWKVMVVIIGIVMWFLNRFDIIKFF